MKFEREPQNTGGIEILNDESIEKDFSFELSNEKDKDGTAIDGKCFWLKFGGAEAKFFVPQKDNNKKLVVFEPGLPGDSVTWFETNQIQTLLKNGYTALVMRHLGTRTDTERSDVLIHCPERIARGTTPETKSIGDPKEYNLVELAEEPAMAVNTVGKNFDSIILVGHSSGALYNAYSINHIQPALRDKITNFVSLSGYLGCEEEKPESFSNLKNFYKYCAQFIKMGDAEENTRLTQQILKEVHGSGIPENIMVVQVNSPQDEYIPISWAKQFQGFLGRGLNITDQTQFETEFHDLKNLQPGTLLRLLKMHYPKSKHTIKISQQ